MDDHLGEDRRSEAHQFTTRMFLAVCEAALGAFDDNLWGIAFTTEFETETVDLHLFFEVEPTDLDRYEISEFAFAFDAIGEVGLRIHRTVMAAERFVPDHGPLIWCFRRRHPAAELPDDVGFEELDY
ncbi:MAG: hypothetical protein R2707_14235 [Acidimicrobiales bacterium]